MNTTAEQIAELTRLHEAATPGPWDVAWHAQRKPIAKAASTEHEGKPFGLYGDAMEPVNTDVDLELAAALRNSLPSILSDLSRLAELEAIVDKLPKTADGVPVMPGMTVFFTTGKGCSVNGIVQHVTSACCGNTSGAGLHWWRSTSDCYSTREAAEAAMAEK